MKASHIILITVLVSSLLIGGVQADVTNWNYTTPGTFTWTCPVNVTHVVFYIGGAGGGGKGSANSDGSYKYGLGGSAGQNAFIPSTDVSPGSNYTIVIGTGGPGQGVDAGAANAGTLSSAFGTTKNGGAGGVLGASSNHNGGDGEAGFLTGGNAADGTAGDCTSYVGGTKGAGYSAGGGGGCGQVTPIGAGSGGAGSDGVVLIYSEGSYTGNAPDFSATPLTGISGTLVHFTDLSVITDPDGLSYNWSFGDGTYSAEIGDPQHVYQYIGSYDVSLTITSDSGSITTEKEAYINLVNKEGTTVFWSPQNVQFLVLDANRGIMTNTFVRADAIESTLPGGYSGCIQTLENAYGVPSSQATLMLNSATLMNGTTDSTGGLVFTMLPTIKYNVNVTDAAGVTYTTTFYPKDTYYVIKTNNATYTQPQNVVSNYNSASYDTLNITEPDVYHVTYQLYYYDALAHTDSLRFWVFCESNQTFMNNQTVIPTGNKGPVYLNYTAPNIRGEVYRWGYDAGQAA